jgi:hypothetical protein
MNLLRFIVRIVPFTALNLAVAAAMAAPPNSATPAAASEVAPRVQVSGEAAARVVLHGNTHPLIQAGAGQAGTVQARQAQSSTDLGAVEDSLPAGRMLLLLKRSPEQDAALADFIQAAHTPGSPSFHQWLKPAEFGRLYGSADSDVAAVTAWLESHGLTVNQVHAGRLAIEFSGTAGQVSEAFQTQIRRYLVNDVTHLANATDPSIPAELAPVIAGLAQLNDFHPQPRLRVMGQAQFNARTHQTTPQWTYPEGVGVVLVVAPGDFATQYDINSVYASGITGSGQSIAIISASNVDLSLVQAYQRLFGLTANLPQVVVDGVDPGQNSAATEAYLDIELAGSVAPGATVLLYTSGGTALTDGLALAAMRAVEDDQAGVISVSYGECEMELGQSGNAFWSALWQQAAAQGQTVFVSSGDGGSAGCDNFDAQSVAYAGLQVNGLASTPYNVAVGGTDFYYSQYAGSSAAITAQLDTYWSTSSTTSPAVSLKQTVPEQVWNDFFGFNIYDSGNPANQPSEMIVAGGGGASSDALYPSGTGQGYPKPAWQTGNGVPADQVRDLPDVSLFAANGYNYSFYPICASPGDCSSANLTNNGAMVITGVGGTSASSPAMAAIQSLVNQSTGAWAGQADFIYYPLAARQATAFHDVTVGGIRVLCSPGTANCVAGSSASNSNGYSVENGYSAGTGYDLATGLGSVDVANLIKYWNTVTFTPTATTLSVSPASLAHGKTATVSGTVARSSGSGTPTGSVSLTGNDGLPHYAAIDDIALSAGSFSAPVDNLPGGTYQLTAVYGGDGTFAASKSAPITVTITPENNTLAANGWAWNPSDLNLYPLSAGITLPYGAQILLDAQPVSSNATISTEPTPATGTVTFTDKLGSATITATQPLNATGVAEWSNGVFAPGNHIVSESYSGDPSYNPSTAATAASFTVIPGNTTLTVKPLVSSVTAGASVAVDVILTTGYLSLYGTLPTGNVTVTLGNQLISATWQPFGTTGNASLEAVVTFSNVPAGTLPLSAAYAGDTNWLGSAASGGTISSLASKLTPSVVLTSNSASPTPGQTFTLTATAAGPSGKPTPTGTVAFISDGQSFESFVNLSSGTASIAIPGYSAANGTNIFTAVYQGDGNYNSAASNAVNVTIAQSDFSFTTQNAEVQISPSGSGISTLALAPVNGFSGTVTLTASAPSGLTVTPAAASLALSAPATDVLTLKVAAATASGIYPLTITANGGGHIHTVQILVRVLVVAAPVYSLPAGIYATSQQVTLTDTATGAAIYYTTNGAIPSAFSTSYTGAITVSTTQTIHAIAFSGSVPSSVTSATYTIGPAVYGCPSGSGSCVDNFTGTSGMLLPTYNSMWVLAGGTNSIYATGSNSAQISGSASAVYYYSASTSDTSQVTVAPSNTTTGYEKMACVRVSSGIAGYCVGFSAVSNGNYSTCSVAKNFMYLGGGSCGTVSATTSHTLGLVASGTSTVTLSVYVDEVLQGTVTDNSSPYTVAGSGFGLQGDGTATDSTVNEWQDYSGGSPAATPTFSPAAGVYPSAQTVTISDATSGAAIYYTTDGSTPTASSTIYTAAILVSSSETLQAIATASGSSTSAVAAAAYTITSAPPPAAATPIFSPEIGTYTSAQSVTISDATAGATIYYTTNGATPTASSTIYTAAILVSSSETLQAIATASGSSTSAVGAAAYTITSASPQAATPIFSPGSGTYASAQSVTISDATAGATIYYTTNGATPTASSTIYTAAILVSSTETLQAIATASGSSTSAVAVATYTINLTVPAFTIGGTAVTVAPGATTGNASTNTVTPSGGFTGNVALTATITASPTGARDLPILSFGSTSPVSITNASAGTAILTVSTTAPMIVELSYPARPGTPYTAASATLACLLLIGIPARRRSWLTMFGMLALLVALAGGVLACGGGGVIRTPGTTAGTYTITVTGISGTISAANTISLTVQ